MSTMRQLPSGNWQCGVFIRGERAYYTHPLKKAAENWGADQEAAGRKGKWINPNRGKVTLAEFWETYTKNRVVEKNTRDRQDSHWRNWLEPQWGNWTLLDLEGDREAIKGWVAQLVEDEVGPTTIRMVTSMLGSILTEAVESGRIGINSAARIHTPPIPKRSPFFWRHEEARAIVEEMPDAYRLMVDFDLHVGPRFEELAGLLVDCVNLDLGVVEIVRVMVDGVLREYPKSSKSHRTVPIPPHELDEFDDLVRDRDGDELVWTAPAGGPLRDENFRDRIFYPALGRARICSCPPPPTEELVTEALEAWKCNVGRHHWRNAPRCACQPDDMGEFAEKAVLSWRCSNPRHAVRRGTPHDMRHTAASWLAMAGVDQNRIQDLLGHEDLRTTRRYMHLDPTKHDAIKAVWGTTGLAAAPKVARARTQSVRTEGGIR